MARYRGPRVKRLRALGVDLPGLTRKSHERRPHPPGEHGQNLRRKHSEYAIRLHEKQKLALHYGLGERQMRRYVVDARRSHGNMGEKLIELLERRLDNVVFRAGFAPTIPAARQLVSHGHITVNGRRVNIASYRVAVGDVVRPAERSLTLAPIETSLESMSLARPGWIDFDGNRRLGRIVSLPTPDSVPFPLEVQLVVEFYSKRM